MFYYIVGFAAFLYILDSLIPSGEGERKDFDEMEKEWFG